MSFYTIYDLTMTKGDGDIGTAQLGQSISIKGPNISYQQNNNKVDLKWYDNGGSLINATQFSIPIQGYGLGTNEHTINVKLYVDGKLQDSGTLTGVTYNGSSTSWINWEPYINWTRSVDINSVLTSDRKLDIEIEVTGGGKEYTYKGNVFFATMFIDLTKLDIDASSSTLTLAPSVNQTVSLTFRPELVLESYLRYKTSGVDVTNGTLSTVSESTYSKKMQVQFAHHSNDEINMRAETDTVQLYIRYLTSSLPDVYFLSGSEVLVDAYTLKVDPTYISKNLTFGTKAMLYASQDHTYPASWGYLQNQSLLQMPLTIDIPITRGRNATLQISNDCPAASIEGASLGTQQVTAETIINSPLTADGLYYHVSFTVVLPLYYAGVNSFTYNFVDGGNIARPSTTVTKVDSNFTVVEYYAPSIIAFDAYRATRAGSSGAITEKVDSTNIAFTASWKIASVGNKNTTKVRKIDCSYADTLQHTIPAASINNGVETYYSSFVFNTERSYKMVFTVTDQLDYTASYTFVLPPAAVFMDFKAGGKGMGIGKVAESDQLEIQFNTDFFGDVNFRGKVSGLTPAEEGDLDHLNVNGESKFYGNVSSQAAIVVDFSGANNVKLPGITSSSSANTVSKATTFQQAATFNGNVTFSGNVSGLSVNEIVASGIQSVTGGYCYWEILPIKGSTNKMLQETFVFSGNSFSGSSQTFDTSFVPSGYSRKTAYPVAITIGGYWWYDSSKSSGNIITIGYDDNGLFVGGPSDSSNFNSVKLVRSYGSTAIPYQLTVTKRVIV